MRDPINDAEAYGVRIVPASVSPGAEYWQIIRIHHLPPEVNNGRHHLFFDALDAAGQRVFGAHILISWPGGGHEVIIDKPLPEPGANEPLWAKQVVSAEALGLPSDRAENLHTGHPDEAPGNTLFHHSFEIIFRRAVAGQTSQQSVIRGSIPGGAGHTLVLRDESGGERTTPAVDDASYRFEGLAAGRYTVADLHDGRRIGPVEVNGVDEVIADFPALPADKALGHYFLFGPPDQPAARLYLDLLADHLAARRLAFGFSPTDAAKATRVGLVGEHTAGVLATLQAAGAQLEQLPLDPAALLKALTT
jgi:hypothetical protein